MNGPARFLRSYTANPFQARRLLPVLILSHTALPAPAMATGAPPRLFRAPPCLLLRLQRPPPRHGRRLRRWHAAPPANLLIVRKRGGGGACGGEPASCDGACARSWLHRTRWRRSRARNGRDGGGVDLTGDGNGGVAGVNLQAYPEVRKSTDFSKKKKFDIFLAIP